MHYIQLSRNTEKILKSSEKYFLKRFTKHPLSENKLREDHLDTTLHLKSCKSKRGDSIPVSVNAAKYTGNPNNIKETFNKI